MKKTILAAVIPFILLCAAHLVCAQPYATTSVRPQRRAVTAPFDADRFKGKSVLALAYSIDNPRAGQAVEFLQDIAKIKNEFNFEVIGININADRTDAALQFNRKHGATFPLLIDKKGELAKNLNLFGNLTLYIFNKTGQLAGSSSAASIPKQRDLGQAWRVYVNRTLKLGFTLEDEPILGNRPEAPFFEAEALSGARIDTRQLYGKKPVILLVFSPMCSHCLDEQIFLTGLLKTEEFKNKFSILGVSRHNRKLTARFMKEHGFTFPVVLDKDNAVTLLFPSFAGVVPVTYIIDTSSRIYARHTGFSDQQKDVYLMELRKLLGLPNKPLLDSRGYSGHDRCQICHEKQHIQWSLTKHPYAFKSLQRKGKDDDPACVSCHVTGWAQPGGYSLKDKFDARGLRGVQCESCHGPGYQSCSAFTGQKQKKKSLDEWKALCLSCHTEQESLNFNFSRRFPRVLHGNAPDVSNMTREQILKLLHQHKAKNDLFGNPASYVGAESCRKCHEQEYAQWSTTVHASAGRLPAAQRASEDKKFRYNTGMGHAGGYPAEGMQGVQCEACHGPGERHIQQPDKKGQDYIVGLGGQCDSCVVEQICRNCHGPEDDPNFDFEQSRKRIKHRPEKQR